MNIANHSQLNHQIEILGGVESEECGQLLSDFFKRRRAEKKEQKLKG